MKTLFVCASDKINQHVGEEYDAVIEVNSCPTTENVDPDAQRIMDAAVGLWDSMDGKDNDRRVVCTLHGPNVFLLILLNLEIILKKEKGIVLDLSGIQKDVDVEVKDQEAIDLLKKLG